ncbi:MAG: hypothetical protein VZR23_07195 [Lachnospiraceae bacterium]|jgi:hypothetical protein|nr:hypothetical protein [Lachnospiraceae bacterium]
MSRQRRSEYSGRLFFYFKEVAAYYAVFTPLSTILGQFLADQSVNEYIVTIGNLLINGVTEYLYQRLFVFGASIDSAKAKKARAVPRI